MKCDICNSGLTVEEIDKIVELVKTTNNEDVKNILVKYLAWNLAPPPVVSNPQPGEIRFL